MVHNAAAMKSKAFEAKWALCFGRTIERWGKPLSHYLLVMGHAAEFSGQFWSEGPTEYFLKNLQPFSFFSQTTTSLLLFFSLGWLKLTWASILPLLSSRIPPWLAWGHKPQMVSQSLRLTLSTVRLLESDLKNPLQNTTIAWRVQRYLIGQMVRLTSLLWTWATQSALRRPEQPKQGVCIIEIPYTMYLFVFRQSPKDPPNSIRYFWGFWQQPFPYLVLF